LLAQIARPHAVLAASESQIDPNLVFRQSHDLPNPFQTHAFLHHPRSTRGSSPKAIPTLAGSILAGDFPRAIMIRPQLGSWPLIAVLTRGELATALAALSASRPLAAPRTATVTSLVAPSPSATSMRASFVITASRPAANWR